MRADGSGGRLETCSKFGASVCGGGNLGRSLRKVEAYCFKFGAYVVGGASENMGRCLMRVESCVSNK